MSTRSIVAFETEKGIVGVYVHSNGYPEGEVGRLNQLDELIKRDGITKVATTILSHSHWSCLFFDCLTRPKWSQSFEILVAGYGLYFDRVAGEHYFTPEELDDWWDSEYIYLLNPEGQVRWAHLGVRGSHEDWDAIEWRMDVPEEGWRRCSA